MHRYGYNPDEDYSQKIAEAAAKGDFAAAARYERRRNEKILGEGLDYPTTDRYARYLPASDRVLDRIADRQPFSYDLSGDALYRQYRDDYLTQGRRAMEDAMGQAATLTGGYANSYAQTVGQRAYDDSLSRLDDLVPELYSLAYERYADEGDYLNDLYDRLAAEEQAERDQASEGRDEAYRLALSMLQSGVMPSDALLERSGISPEDARSIYDKANAPQPTSTASRGGSSSGSAKGKTVSVSERGRLAELYEQGGDDAIAATVAAYRAAGYDVDEVLDWLHTYYQPPDPWWKERAENAKGLIPPWWEVPGQ